MDSDTLVWKDEYSVGFEPIDAQHKQLVAAINGLIQGSRRGAAAADVAFIKTLKSAIEYAQTHFSTEEKYMLQAAYPDLAEHKKQHEAFVAEIVIQLRAFESGKNEPSVLLTFLKDWLLDHIAVMDKKYAPYLAKLG
jgi:hemerythrin